MTSEIKDKLEDDVLNSYKGKWRNMYFSRFGQNWVADKLWDTSSEAEQSSASWIAKYKDSTRFAPTALEQGIKVMCKDISHAIPMPVSK